MSLQQGLLLTGGGIPAYSGGAAAIEAGIELWSAYRAAQMSYSMSTGLGTGAVVGGASYTGKALVGAAYDSNFGARQSFEVGFGQRFSYSGLVGSMVVGVAVGGYSTAMFNWAGVPNALSNWASIPGAIIRTNSAAIGASVGQVVQSSVKSSNNNR